MKKGIEFMKKFLSFLGGFFSFIWLLLRCAGLFLLIGFFWFLVIGCFWCGRKNYGGLK